MSAPPTTQWKEQFSHFLNTPPALQLNFRSGTASTTKNVKNHVKYQQNHQICSECAYAYYQCCVTTVMWWRSKRV